MKTRVSISGLFQKDIGQDLFIKLVTIYPEGQCGQGGNVFMLNLVGDDPRTEAVMDALHFAGLQPINGGMAVSECDSEKFYSLNLHRDYDANDLAAFNFFEIRVPYENTHWDIERAANGKLFVPLPPSFSGFDFSELNFFRGKNGGAIWYLVPQRIQTMLASAGLKKLKLSPTDYFLKDEAEDFHSARPLESLWEVGSDLILPPVSPVMLLKDKDGKQAWPGKATGYKRISSIYSWPELHYRASDVRAIEEFDIAQTLENFGWSGSERMPDFNSIVVSKKFFDVANQLKLEIDWLPVHIDPI